MIFYNQDDTAYYLATKLKYALRKQYFAHKKHIYITTEKAFRDAPKNGIIIFCKKCSFESRLQTHNVGFLFRLSFVIKFKVKVTHNLPNLLQKLHIAIK